MGATTLMFGPLTIPDGYKIIREGKTIIASPTWPEMKTNVLEFSEGILMLQNGTAVAVETVLPAKPGKKAISAATRKKLAAASKKRWNEVKATKALAAKAGKKAA